MAERERGARRSAAPAPESGRRRKACCLVSEMLEETGLDRRHVRMVKRQVLEGLILLCRWQLERMGPDGDDAPRASRAARKVPVE